MVKLINVLVLASGLAATAFSLERKVQRISERTFSGNNKISGTFSKARGAFHSSPSYLKAEGGSAEIVAAAKEVPVASKSFIDKIWNEDTKLTGKVSFAVICPLS